MRSSSALALAAILIACSAHGIEAESTPRYTRNVAIVVYKNVQPLDWTGPFEVYNDAGSFGSVAGKRAFNVYTVSKSDEPLNGQGLIVKPTYSIKNAPKPDIVVFPGGPASIEINGDPEFFAWARQAATEAEIAQSVCTGAFVLGKAGLLDGLTVTTFYGAIEGLQKSFPKANVMDGRRFVDNGKVLTTAGISAGIDGSLHVVARLLGRRVADQTARYMEYHWTPDSYLARSYQYLNPSTDDTGRMLQAGETLHESKQYAEAAQVFVKASKSAEGHALAGALYNAACAYTMAGNVDAGAEYLQKAFAAGYPDREAVNNDPDLAALKNNPKLAAKTE